MSPFAALPVELVRDILELAADGDLSTSVTLSRVNRAVKYWTEPSLYETVVLESASALSSFAAVLQRRPPIAAHVKHLGLLAPGPLPTVHRILHACARVPSLACGFSLPSYASQYPDEPPLALAAREQHLLMSACRDGRWETALSSPYTTHLRLHIDAESWDVLSPARLAAWPALTHLAVVLSPCAPTPGAPDDIPDALETFLRVLDDVPLQVLLVQVAGGKTRKRSAVQRLKTLGKEHGAKRLVVEPAPVSTVRQWEDLARAGKPGAMWDGAVAEVALRAENWATS
ncbi:hypothetical protein PENSPDRAFT_651284 [Peniophora sp. CONT]|nr:hypothetical protein PENSPDRAFT_651284 [Peniophora sp. CONT]